MLITYGDQVTEPDAPPLQTLAEFVSKHLKGVVRGVHVLPFYPFSSDDGFSVVDYCKVDPTLGSWEHINRLGDDFRLMFDAVINHISAQSEWFKAFLQDQQPYTDYFYVVDPGVDLSMVVRPRALPLLTAVMTPSGIKHVWTTFSEDQIDLNYANPDVLLEVVDILLFYVSQGAEFIRLDAIAFLWKEIGTSSIHLEQTHQVIRLFRNILDAVAPGVMLITETNVPHADNVSYFGNGKDEAQMVYNFALPPLTLHTLQTADATALSRWAKGLTLPSKQVTFFNFLASHDGIGLNPARGILSDEEISSIVSKTKSHGGLVSYKQNPDGTQSPYELNINYFDALSNPESSQPVKTQIERFIAAHAIMLAMIGVPGIYFHSLFGSRGWKEGVALSGHNRSINRQKLKRRVVEGELADMRSLRYQVFARLKKLLSLRAGRTAFHPYGEQQVFELDPSVFCLLRTSPDGADRVLCLHNVTPSDVPIKLSLNAFAAESANDLNDPKAEFHKKVSLKIGPYQVLWLELDPESQPPPVGN
ncbi:MAG TPA: sugar phosphorylase [Anaerolineales bacterium]|nr:sugar phosphorylase [Anaerolineales bacterium]